MLLSYYEEIGIYVITDGSCDCSGHKWLLGTLVNRNGDHGGRCQCGQLGTSKSTRCTAFQDQLEMQVVCHV